MMNDNIINPLNVNDDDYELLIKSAISFLDLRGLSEAADKCSMAIRLDQDRCEAYLVLSVAAYLLDDLGRAMELAVVAHENSPDCLEVTEALAHYHAYAGSMNDSIYFAKLGTIGESNPLLAKIYVEGLNSLPKAINESKKTSYRVDAMRAYYEERYADAIVSFDKELRLHKGDAELYRLFGHCLCEVGNISRGLAAIQGAIQLEPKNAENYTSLASAYSQLGDYVLAKSCFNRALAVTEDLPKTLSNVSSYQDKIRIPWQQLDQALEEWFEKENSLNKYTHDDRETVRNEVLSIGFIIDRSCVSDISRIIEPMLWHHDREAVEYYVYSMDIPNDSAPLKLKNTAKYWLDTYDIRRGTLAATINSHNLDLLIDITVTDKGYCPEVIRSHPARKIYRWFGPGEGVFSRGYDGVLTVAKKKKSEKDSIMPIVLDPDVMPKIEGASPYHSQDYITFGANCDLSKLTPDVAMVWGEVLRSIPGSRLTLGNATIIKDEIKNRCIEMLTAAGVFGCIDFEEMSPGTSNNRIISRLEFMVSIDVFLDTFPSNGFVELADSLWAGVPVVALSKNNERNMAEAILVAGECGEYIARDTQQYVAHAVKAANSVMDDKSWRLNMHNKVRKSVLFSPEQWDQVFLETITSIARPIPVKKRTTSLKKGSKPTAGVKKTTKKVSKSAKSASSSKAKSAAKAKSISKTKSTKKK